MLSRFCQLKSYSENLKEFFFVFLLYPRKLKMDFENLINDSLEDNDNYVRLQDREEVEIGRNDFVKAKSFLSTVNPRLSISL